MSLEKAVLDAAKTNKVEVLGDLLSQLADQGIPMHAVRDQFGSTPLHWAAGKGHVGVAVLLLEQGFPPSIANDTGDTPLHWATLLNKPEVVDTLILFNAELDVVNSKGASPYDIDCNPAIRTKLEAYRRRLDEASMSSSSDRLNQYINDAPSPTLARPPAPAPPHSAPPPAPPASAPPPPPPSSIPPPPPPEDEYDAQDGEVYYEDRDDYDDAPPAPPADDADYYDDGEIPGPPEEPFPASPSTPDSPPPPPPSSSVPTRAPPPLPTNAPPTAAAPAPYVLPEMPKRAPEPEESDDEGADAGGDEQPMMEFWDEAEEAQFQKMVIHFGRERAEIALYEMRRIKEKKGEAPINRRPGMNLVPLGSAAAAAAAGVAPPPKAEQPAKVKEVKQLTPEEQARQERAAHMLAQVDLGNDRAVKQALEAGVDVNSADEQGNTGLHLAAINGDKKMVSVFLKNKVRKNGKNKRGQTALMLAVAEQHLDVVRALLKSKAKVDFKDKDHRTPLMTACVTGNFEFVSTLIAAGADPTRVDKTSMSCLMIAAAGGFTQLVAYLLDLGAPIDAINKFQFTALMFAASYGMTETAALLYSRGATISQKSNRGKDAKTLANASGHLEIVDLFSRDPPEPIHVELPVIASPVAAVKGKASGAPNTEVAAWSEGDVTAWLNSLGKEFSRYAKPFAANNINGRRLVRLNDEKLQNIGIASLGHRDDILEQIAILTQADARV